MTEQLNSMYRFDGNFYLYLKKIKNHLIYAHHTLEPNCEDKFYCEKMIYFKEIKSIEISLEGDSNNKISVKVTFINENDNLESHDLSGSHQKFYFDNFIQVAKYINLLTSFVYSESMIEINCEGEINFGKYSSKLDDYENRLLSFTYNTPFIDSILVGELFDGGSMKYYYDVKIFDFVSNTCGFANKRTLVSFEYQEGFSTKCSIVFFTTPFLSMQNVDMNFRSTYSVELIDAKDRQKYVISRLSRENYIKLKTWIEQKLNL